jgi:hypothetical protein
MPGYMATTTAGRISRWRWRPRRWCFGPRPSTRSRRSRCPPIPWLPTLPTSSFRRVLDQPCRRRQKRSPEVLFTVEWETALTPQALLLLPGNQQFKFTAALARRVVTVWASDRSIHVVLDGAVIRTRPSRLSEHDLRDLLARGARIAGPQPARGAVTVDVLTSSSVIEVDRTVSRDKCVGLGGHKALLEASLVGQRVTVRFKGALMHVVANDRLVKTLPAPLPPNQRAALRGARPTSEPLPPPTPPQRAMRRVAANGTVTVAGQRLRIGRSYYGQTVTIAIEDTVFRVLLNGAELSTHARRPDTNITILKAYPAARASIKPKVDTYRISHGCLEAEPSSIS